MVASMNLHGYTNELIQWEYQSNISYNDPFNDIELDVTIVTPKQKQFTVPTFWTGKQTWAIRFIPEEVGEYSINTNCSDSNNLSLHKHKSTLNIHQGEEPLQKPLSLSQNKRYLIQNNKPFFWLSDTWWMALSSRLTYPKKFEELTAYRKAQGFNIIMLVAGLFPDMGSFDERSTNEAGFAWEKNYAQINPHYFNEADKRITHLIDAGLTPCILGAWGYYLQELGIKKMKQHWRYIIARWGIYPVVWGVAGEATMPYYLSTHRQKDAKYLKKGWTEIAHYIKELDPFHRLLTIHPTEVGKEQLMDNNILDINLLQASHHGYGSISNSTKLLNQEKDKKPIMPMIMSELNYEGILRDTHDAVQRLGFWSAILSGSKGYGYGANGIWQINTEDNPFGATPHGGTWGNTPWEEALKLNGAKHICASHKILETYEWWLLEPMQDYIIPVQDVQNPKSVYLAGIKSYLRIAYFYNPVYPWEKPHFQLTHLNPDTSYTGFFIDPKNGQKHTITNIKISSDGCWEIPSFPSYEDWVVVLRFNANSRYLLKNKKKSFSLISLIIKKLWKKL